uniref:Uncharacterized protein n=1 Tax=Oryza glumipatula TaxID=40148 RepID=A0A0E0AJ29_9ORYZ
MNGSNSLSPVPHCARLPWLHCPTGLSPGFSRSGLAHSEAQDDRLWLQIRWPNHGRPASTSVACGRPASELASTMAVVGNQHMGFKVKEKIEDRVESEKIVIFDAQTDVRVETGSQMAMKAGYIYTVPFLWTGLLYSKEEANVAMVAMYIKTLNQFNPKHENLTRVSYTIAGP